MTHCIWLSFPELFNRDFCSMPLKANEVQKVTVLVMGTSVLEVRAHISTPVNFLKDSQDPSQHLS